MDLDVSYSELATWLLQFSNLSLTGGKGDTCEVMVVEPGLRASLLVH